MYTIGVKREFIAQHYLVGGDWGPENEKHSHHYRVEVQLRGAGLDAHGYLVDITDIEPVLDSLVAEYRDRTLNELPEFKRLNPSIEQFARIIYDKLSDRIQAANVSAISVTVWENDSVWASYREEI